MPETPINLFADPERLPSTLPSMRKPPSSERDRSPFHVKSATRFDSVAVVERWASRVDATGWIGVGRDPCVGCRR